MKFFRILFIASFIVLFYGCSCNCGEEDINLEVHLKYGYNDEVNTFENYLKKDLVQAGTADTTFSFTPSQKNAILAKANDIGFFDLPNKIDRTADFEQNPSPGEQYLKIKYEDWENEVTWFSPVGQSDNEQNIKELSYLIINFVIDSDEYKALPAAEGGYL